MKICSHCNKKNPDATNYCLKCGNDMKFIVAIPARKSIWSMLPSWAWIFIGLAAIALFLAIIIGGFVALATIEGVASILLLAAGIICFGVFSGKPATWPAVMRAIGVGFFALMGATIDQTGNLIYNKPVEMCMCQKGAELQRRTITSHPLPGRTDMTQDFACVKDGKIVETLNVFPIFGIRFLEYMLLAYLLLGVRWLLWKWKIKAS